MRKFVCLSLLLVVGACGSGTKLSVPPTDSVKLGIADRTAGMVNPLQGHVFLRQPIKGASVRVYDSALFGHNKTALAAVETDADGHFAVDLRAFEGGAWVEVNWPGAEVVLTAAVAKVELGTPTDEVAVTPITTLATAYTGYLVQHGAHWEDAARQSTERMEAHFLGLPHRSLEPQPWPKVLSGGKATCRLEPSMQASLLTQALFDQASSLKLAHHDVKDENHAFALLLQALCRDVSADGLFDGLGDAGAAVVVGEGTLGAEAVREDLADHMVTYLLGPANLTQCDAAQVQPMVDHLLRSSAPLFASASIRSDVHGRRFVVPPKLVGCNAVNESNQALDLNLPVRGLVRLHCAWEDNDRMVKTRTGTFRGSEFLQRVEGQSTATDLVVVLDTAKLQGRYPEIERLRVPVLAWDAANQLKTEEFALLLKNTPPKLDIYDLRAGGQDLLADANQIWRNDKTTVHAGGRAGLDAVEVQLWANAELVQSVDLTNMEVGHDESMKSFAFDVDDLPCDSDQKLVMRALDIAGNATEQSLMVSCVACSPTIDPGFTAYAADFGQTPPKLTHEGWSGEPVTFAKYYNKFNFDPAHGQDHASENLPVVSFTVQQKDPGNLLGRPKVFYRYLFAGKEARTRNWEPMVALNSNQPNFYALPLSYQTLLPQQTLAQPLEMLRKDNFIARSAPEDLHTLEIKAVNDAGLETVRTFSFRLQLASPSLHLHSLRTTPWFQDIRYAEIYDKHQQHQPAFRMAAHWPVECDDTSLFVCEPLKLRTHLAVATRAGLIAEEQEGHEDVYTTYNKEQMCREQGRHSAWTPSKQCQSIERTGFKVDRKVWPSPRPNYWAQYQTELVNFDVAPGPLHEVPFYLGRNLPKDTWRWDEARPGRHDLGAWVMHEEEGKEWHGNDVRLMHLRFLAWSIYTRAEAPPSSQIEVVMPWGVPAPVEIVNELRPTEKLFNIIR